MNSKPLCIENNGSIFKITDKIDRTANSLIFKCTSNEKQYAIKFYKNKDKKRYKSFVNEKDFINYINGRYKFFTPSIKDYKFPDAKELCEVINDLSKAPFVVLELGKRINYAGYNVERKIDLVIRICERLEQMHKLGYHHLDLKMDNVLEYKNDICLIDFSTCDYFDIDKNRITNKGNKATIAPEMRMNAVDIKGYDYKYADIYSLGKTMWMIFSEKSEDYCSAFVTYDDNNEYCKMNIEDEDPVIEKHIGRIIKMATVERFNNRISIENIKKEMLYVKHELLKNEKERQAQRYRLILDDYHYASIDEGIINTSDKRRNLLANFKNILLNIEYRTDNNVLFKFNKACFNVKEIKDDHISFYIDQSKRLFNSILDNIVINGKSIVLKRGRYQSFYEDGAIRFCELNSFEQKAILNNDKIYAERILYIDCDIILERINTDKDFLMTAANTTTNSQQP